jgi:choline dehydrogenase-like flavoprotein
MQPSDRQAARPASEDPDRWDAVVVGTGFGGSVAACRLAQATHPSLRRVLVLERGRRYDHANDFPRPPIPMIHPKMDGAWETSGLDPVPVTADDETVGIQRLLWSHDGGLWDIRDLGQIQVVMAAGLGGGSLVYANVFMQPPDAVLTRIPGLEEPQKLEALKRYYGLAAYMMQATSQDPWPDPASEARAQVFTELMDRADLQPLSFRPRVAVNFKDGANPFGIHQPACTGEAGCSMGCQTGAKNTLDKNYLAIAEGRAGPTHRPEHPAHIRVGCEVRTLERVKVPGEAGHWRVGWMDLLTGEEAVVAATHVFLAAGAVHTTELLLRNRVGIYGEAEEAGTGADAARAEARGALQKLGRRLKARPQHHVDQSGATAYEEDIRALSDAMLKLTSLLDVERPGKALGERFHANADALAAIYSTNLKHAPTAGVTITSTTYVPLERSESDTARRGPAFFLLENGSGPKSLVQLSNWLGGPLRPAISGFDPLADDPDMLKVEAFNPLEVYDSLKKAVEGGLQVMAHRPRAAGKYAYPPLGATIGKHADDVRSWVEFGLIGQARKEGTDAVTKLAGQTAYDLAFNWLGCPVPEAVRRWLAKWAKKNVEGVATDLGQDKDFEDKIRELAEKIAHVGVLRLRNLLSFDGDIERRMICLLMGRDEKAGRLELGPGGLFAEWKLSANREVIEGQERLLRRLVRVEGAGRTPGSEQRRPFLRVNPIWSLTEKPVTVHPLGGATMGEPGRGVLDEWGAVRDTERLYVVDGSIFPESLGVNPSASILAFAERNVAKHISDITQQPFVAPQMAQAAEWPNAEPLLDAVANAAGLSRTLSDADVEGPSNALPAAIQRIRKTELTGLTFHEVMVGYFAPLNRAWRHDGDLVTQSRRGEQAGILRGADHLLRVELDATIEDLGSFLRTREHVVQMKGTAWWPPVSGTGPEGFPIKGSLKLFPASKGVGLPKDIPQRMEYTLHSSQEIGWSFSGNKLLRDDPGVDVLVDTTTTFGTIKLRGHDDQHGLLKVHLQDLLHTQLPSFRVTGTEDYSEQLAVMARFLSFFFGKLARTYFTAALSILAPRRPR